MSRPLAQTSETVMLFLMIGARHVQTLNAYLQLPRYCFSISYYMVNHVASKLSFAASEES